MKTVHVRSAMPIYVAAAVFFLFALLLPVYRFWAILLAGVLAAGAGIASEKFVFKGRDIEVETKIETGDREIDEQLEEARGLLKKLADTHTGDALIDDPLSRMVTSGNKIIEAVAEKPEKASQVRKFLNYYLPTTAKLMTHYNTLTTTAGGKGEHVSRAINDLRSSLNMIADAFEKQLDHLYRAEAMDVSTDIDVMEAMIAADGLTDDGVRMIMKEDQSK